MEGKGQCFPQERKDINRYRGIYQEAPTAVIKSLNMAKIKEVTSN